MQQEQRIHTIQENVSDNMPSAFSIRTDPSKPQDQQQDENQQALEKDTVKNQQDSQYQVTQQPIGSNNLDYYNRKYPTNTLTKKKKNQPRRRPAGEKQSDEKYYDNSGTWLCNCGGCGSCGSCGSAGSGGSGGSGGGGSGGSGGS